MALTLGMFCFVGIYFAHDSFAEIAAVCVTLASATAIAGRNYGSPRMVMIFIITLTWPMSLGFILRGDVYHVMLGLLSVPFLLAIQRFADSVRDVLFTAIFEEKKAKRIAQRFNRALNTMSHGLVMLGPDGRVVVANAEAAQLMSLKSPDALLGRSIHALLMRGVAGGMLAAKDCRYVEAQLTTRAARRPRPQGPRLAFQRPALRVLGARGQPGTRRHHLRGCVGSASRPRRRSAPWRASTASPGLPNRAYFHEIVGEAHARPATATARLRHRRARPRRLQERQRHARPPGRRRADLRRRASGLRPLPATRVKVSRFGGDEFMVFFDHVEDESHLAAHPRQHVRRPAGRGRRRRPRAAHPGQRRRGAVARQGHRCRRDDRQGRPGALQGQGTRQERLAAVRGGDGRRLPQPPADEGRSAQPPSRRGTCASSTSRSSRMDTMRIASCEALCRWDHRDLGPISPAVFIPLAEEMGIISEISTFVLNAACAECVTLARARSASRSTCRPRISATARSSTRSAHALESSGLAPHRLEIEVTETALLDDKSLTREYIEELKELGVRIALDDFGTGYSSLSYLHKLPLDKVKIDRSFLIDVDAEPALARTAQGHRQPVAAARPDRHRRGRRDLRAAQDPGRPGQARPRAGLPVRFGPVGRRHRDDDRYRLAVRQGHPRRQARRHLRDGAADLI